ncbi:hypothetical protein [Viridibacillus arvi]|uniref:hypothetical protein n=1 Tax=Viridibacillus arvi TaxID=263475 RepID=UPI0034CF7CB5
MKKNEKTIEILKSKPPHAQLGGFLLLKLMFIEDKKWYIKVGYTVFESYIVIGKCGYFSFVINCNDKKVS